MLKLTTADDIGGCAQLLVIFTRSSLKTTADEIGQRIHLNRLNKGETVSPIHSKEKKKVTKKKRKGATRPAACPRSLYLKKLFSLLITKKLPLKLFTGY